jgi:uncharacterized membrane protein YfcA
LTIGFVGGWIAGALGLGGGSIYNPALLTMGIHPRVAGSTGMYLVLFSVINSNTVYIVNGILQVWYGVWISAWSVAGTIGGLMVADWFVKKTGRTSIFVWVLVFMFALSCVIIPISSSGELKEDIDAGVDIWGFTNFCKN